MSGISASMQYGSQAMNVHSWSMATVAHNLANVSTSDFKPQHAVYATGPDGWGVQLDAVVRETTFGLSGETTDATVTGGPAQVLSSGTDVAREMVNMIATQYGYEANAKVIGSADAMLGSLLDMKA